MLKNDKRQLLTKSGLQRTTLVNTLFSGLIFLCLSVVLFGCSLIDLFICLLAAGNWCWIGELPRKSDFIGLLGTSISLAYN